MSTLRKKKKRKFLRNMNEDDEDMTYKEEPWMNDEHGKTFYGYHQDPTYMIYQPIEDEEDFYDYDTWMTNLDHSIICAMNEDTLHKRQEKLLDIDDDVLDYFMNGEDVYTTKFCTSD